MVTHGIMGNWPPFGDPLLSCMYTDTHSFVLGIGGRRLASSAAGETHDSSVALSVALLTTYHFWLWFHAASIEGLNQKKEFNVLYHSLPCDRFPSSVELKTSADEVKAGSKPTLPPYSVWQQSPLVFIWLTGAHTTPPEYLSHVLAFDLNG